MLVNTKMQREDWLEGRATGSNAAEEEKGWKSLWKVQVSSKIRLFLWRLARQSLPTGDVRNHRHMADTSSCSICGREDSWRHSLIECTPSRCVWALVGEEITQHMCYSNEPNAKLWLFHMMESLKYVEFVEMAVTLWSIWYARRRLIHEGENQSPLTTFLVVKRFMEELAQTPPPPGGGQKKVITTAASASGTNQEDQMVKLIGLLVVL
jgi:hypothetical protein